MKDEEKGQVDSPDESPVVRVAEFRDSDEEYSYQGYADDTIESGESVKFRDNDEEYSYTGYAEETLTAAEEGGRSESYGDFIIEEFSAETNVPRVAKITHLPANVVTYMFAAAYLILGILCVSITDSITHYLSVIVGVLMIVIGLIKFIIAIVKREYRSLKTNQTATSLIIVALGAMILFRYFDPEDDPITLISVVWGILGLFEAAHAFNHAFKRISNGERCVYYLIRGLIELAVSFMLLYQPTSHDAHHLHIIVFGLNLIFDAITMIPPVKAVLSIK